MKRFVSLALVGLAFLAACNDNRTPTSPPEVVPKPSFAISDGAHSGNPNFYFLVPTLPATSSLSNFKLGQFNPKLQPEIVVCQIPLSSGSYPTGTESCGATVADLKFPSDVHVVVTPATTLENSLKQQYTLPADGFYYAVWNTKSAALTPGSYYRVQVMIGTTRLGYVDVTPVSLITGIVKLINLVTNQVVPELQNGTLPIIFRIQNGATCFPSSSCAEATVTNTGGTKDVFGRTCTPGGSVDCGSIVTAATGSFEGAKGFFPNGFLDGTKDVNGNPVTQVVVTIKEKLGTCHNPTANPGLLQFPTCYTFSTNPQIQGRFAKNVTVGSCPSLLSASTVGQTTQLYRSDNGGPATPLEEAFIQIDCSTGPFDHPASIGMLNSSNPFVRLAGRTLDAAGKGLSKVFSPRPLYAWDVGVGGFTDGFSDFGRGMAPNVSIGSSAPLAPTGTQVTITSTVTTAHEDHTECGTEPPQACVNGIPVFFSVTNGAGTLSAASATTNASGVASVTLTLPGAPGATIVAAQLHDVSDQPFGTPVTVTVNAAAGLVTPVASALHMVANSNAGDADVISTDGGDQTTTLQPLSATVSATAQNGNFSVTTEGHEVATWQDAANGQLTATGIGWVATADGGVVTNAHALPFNGLDWSYTFTANVTGTFTLQYHNTVDEGTTNPFGLVGFVYSWSDPAGSPTNQTLCSTCSGTINQSVVAGSKYTVILKNFANISGALGNMPGDPPPNRIAHMSGTFNWSVTSVPIIGLRAPLVAPSLSLAPSGAASVLTQSMTVRGKTTKVTSSMNYQQIPAFKSSETTNKHAVSGSASTKR